MNLASAFFFCLKINQTDWLVDWLIQGLVLPQSCSHFQWIMWWPVLNGALCRVWNPITLLDAVKLRGEKWSSDFNLQNVHACQNNLMWLWYPERKHGMPLLCMADWRHLDTTDIPQFDTRQQLFTGGAARSSGKQRCRTFPFQSVRSKFYNPLWPRQSNSLRSPALAGCHPQMLPGC